MKKIIPAVFILFLFHLTSFGQNGISIINETGNQVMIQKRTILEVGSFPYLLDTTRHSIQNIPIETENPTILNVSIVPKSGPYGSADGIYYLFKPNDTVKITSNSNGQPMVEHITSIIRTKELQFGLQLFNKLPITQFYTLLRKNIKLFSYLNSTNISLKERDRIIDSITRPYITICSLLCKDKNIDTAICLLYKHHFEGVLYYEKLHCENAKYKYKNLLGEYYKDSIIDWEKILNCENCSNIPYYNLATYSIYTLHFNNVSETTFLDTISSLTHGNTKDFLLSRYTSGKLESVKEKEKLLMLYDKLIGNSVYKETVHNNYLLFKSSNKDDSISTILMSGLKTKVRFEEFIESQKGKVIYIDFWASWCRPCIEQIHFSHELSKKLDPSKIVIAYISIDSDFGNWKEACQRFGLIKDNNFILIDPDNSPLSKKLDLSAIPRYIIIDKTGKILNTDASRPSDQNTLDTLLKTFND